MRRAQRIAVAAIAAVASLGALGGPAAAVKNDNSWTRSVHSRPGLRIPRVYVTVHDEGTAPGFMFLTPRAIFPGRTGPVILDSEGHVVWFHVQSFKRSSTNFHPQVYRGKPVLTWSIRPPLTKEGDLYEGGPRVQYHLIADDSYRVIKRVRARGRHVNTDTHDFVITKRDTALVLGYRMLTRRLARYGGPRRGLMIDGLVQEIDLRTNKVLFNWSVARHIPIRDTIVKAPTNGFPFDPYHLNSVSEDSDGNLLVSARHTSAVYKIDRHTGRVIWKLGGKDSSFRMGRGTTFYYQHDAQRQADGTITLFDNEATDVDRKRGRNSRVVKLSVDTHTKRATLVETFAHPSGGVSLAGSQGNAEVLDNGNVFVGWGISPWWSEYAPDGRLLFAAHFSSVWHHSYRAFKAAWSSHPKTKPAVAASVESGALIAYASWNGATDVAQWRVLGGPKDALVPIGTADWADFETKMTFPGKPEWVQVQALDASGAVLGTSDEVKT